MKLFYCNPFHFFRALYSRGAIRSTSALRLVDQRIVSMNLNPEAWWAQCISARPSPTSVTRVPFLRSASRAAWVCCWFSPCSEGFSPGSPVFLPPTKANTSKFQFDRNVRASIDNSPRDWRGYPAWISINIIIRATSGYMFRQASGKISCYFISIDIIVIIKYYHWSPYSPTHLSQQEKVIYHQTMTPPWLDSHASYIDSAHSTTNEQLSFRGGAVANAALLKVPMIPPGVLKDSAPLTVEITVANDVSIGRTMDSDIQYGVSDGTRFVGFQTCDKGNYQTSPPCYGKQGSSGRIISSDKIDAGTPKPSDTFYPGQFVFTLKLDERWGSCYTAHDGGFTRPTRYTNQLMLSKGLSLEVYKDDAKERVGIKYIKVTILKDDNTAWRINEIRPPANI